VDRVKKQIEKKKEKHISQITNQTFTNLINNLQEIHENTNQNTENLVGILKGFKNIQKHLEFLFKNAKKEILINVEKETKKFLDILNTTKTKNINITINSNTKYTDLKSNHKPTTQGTNVRLCVVDDDVVIFPIREEDTHPDYDLGVWVKNKQTTKFLKQIFSSV